MQQMFAAVLVLVATSALDARPQQSSPPAQQGNPPSTQVPAVPEDRRVKTEDIDSVMAKGNVVVLDVRDPKEIDELGGYEGAINIPLPQLEKRLGELPKEKTILTA
ncbi:MAG TPA: hypothetical protein VE379_08080 [Vicinamibacterales bacterium]|jgi:hypothetical protein|nr:hypothetical protein [Vicinamibacterales bacterium]